MNEIEWMNELMKKLMNVYELILTRSSPVEGGDKHCVYFGCLTKILGHCYLKTLYRLCSSMDVTLNVSWSNYWYSVVGLISSDLLAFYVG